MSATSIELTYRRRTATSAVLMERAAGSMPGGSSRTFGLHPPYPVVIDHAAGPFLWDVDGNQYVDLVYNGLSLIHGHAYPPIMEALQPALRRGTAWPGVSVDQIRFAEALCQRIPSVSRVRFTNTGTEAGMLAVKVARRATGRRLVLKAWSGYHGSYDDLEAGLHGQAELPGRTLLARFGDIDSFRKVLDERGDDIACVVVEPVMFTGIVVPPPAGFLAQLQEAARRAGALFVLDDCLMFRLATGGSQERYQLDPDITFLGKFIGGGLPVGVVGGRESVMDVLDHRRPDPLYHGGSFNGNLLGMVAGTVALEHLTADRIQGMDQRAQRLKDGLERKAADAGVPLSIAIEGSVMGVYLSAAMPDFMAPSINAPFANEFALACRNHGVYIGPGGEIALATVIDDGVTDQVIDAVGMALLDVAQHIHDSDQLTTSEGSHA